MAIHFSEDTAWSIKGQNTWLNILF